MDITTWLYSITDFEFFAVWVIFVLLIFLLEAGLKIRELRKTINYLLPIGGRRRE